ncbi:MAG: SH3 domain-containing protein, partial [Chloroflexota bacterium]
GVRLWVNNQLIVDRWQAQAIQSHSGEIELFGGPVPVRMEYFDRTGFAEAHLSWQRLTTPPTGGSGVGTATVTGAYFLNVRSGPGLSNNVVATAARNEVLTLLGYRDSAGTWIMVARANGTQGWVHAGYVRTSVPVNSLTVWTGQDGGGQTGNGTVNTGRLNVRSGPSIDYRVLTVIDHGTSVTITHRNAASTWVRVILPNGTRGWVNASYLQTNVNIGSLPIG